jgi:hypothetical protein
VGGEVKQNIGKEMIKDGFKSAVTTSIKGAIAGGAGGGALTLEAGGVGVLMAGLDSIFNSARFKMNNDKKPESAHMRMRTPHGTTSNTSPRAAIEIRATSGSSTDTKPCLKNTIDLCGTFPTYRSRRCLRLLS